VSEGRLIINPKKAIEECIVSCFVIFIFLVPHGQIAGSGIVGG
jgi:hypothetical protein